MFTSLIIIYLIFTVFRDIRYERRKAKIADCAEREVSEKEDQKEEIAHSKVMDQENKEQVIMVQGHDNISLEGILFLASILRKYWNRDN